MLYNPQIFLHSVHLRLPLSPPPALTEQNKPFSHTDRICLDKQTHLRAFSTSNDKHVSGNVIGEIQDNKLFITKADRVARLIKIKPKFAICRLCCTILHGLQFN